MPTSVATRSTRAPSRRSSVASTTWSAPHRRSNRMASARCSVRCARKSTRPVRIFEGAPNVQHVLHLENKYATCCMRRCKSFQRVFARSQRQIGDHALLPVGGRRRTGRPLSGRRPAVALVRADRDVPHLCDRWLQRTARLCRAAAGSAGAVGEDQRCGQQ